MLNIEAGQRFYGETALTATNSLIYGYLPMTPRHDRVGHSPMVSTSGTIIWATIFQPGPLSKILTGSNPGGPPDMIFTVNAIYVEENYWFDPTALDRTDSKPPLGFTDSFPLCYMNSVMVSDSPQPAVLYLAHHMAAFQVLLIHLTSLVRLMVTI